MPDRDILHFDNPEDVITDAIEWQDVDPPDDVSGDTPYTVKRGVLRIDESELRCYVLSDGQRMFNAEDVAQFFGGDTDA